LTEGTNSITPVSRRLAVISACGFIGFASAHLIEEFLWGAPQEFHLSVEFTLMLSLVFITSLAGLIALAAAGSSSALGGLALAGLLITAADSFKHLGEILQAGPWRFGFASEFLALGLTLSALLTAATSAWAWLGARSRRNAA
jgi:hypothetical protein